MARQPELEQILKKFQTIGIVIWGSTTRRAEEDLRALLTDDDGKLVASS